MTTGATQVFPAAHVTAGERSVGCRTLTNQTQGEIERLIEDLFFDVHGLHRRSILMADVGNTRPSSTVAGYRSRLSARQDSQSGGSRGVCR